MSYTWLKKFDANLAISYPYIEIDLVITPPWKFPVPFHTFSVILEMAKSNLGTYIYVGEYVGKSIEPGRDFEIKAYLRILDIHAKDLREKILEFAEQNKYLELRVHAYVDLINYGNPLGPITKRIPLDKVREWLSSEKHLRNDFIPAPSSNAVDAHLYRKLVNIEGKVKREIEAVLNELKPLITIFKSGIEKYKESIIREVELKYQYLKPISEFITIARSVSNENLDENWALSTLVLATLENIVNLKLKELGESISGDFKTRVSRLKEALIKKSGWDEREASDLARRLRGKYEERHVIIHGGYENPTTREAALEDLEFLKDVLKKLFEWAENA